MEPFSGLELTFVIIAFIIFSLFGFALVFGQPNTAEDAGCEEKRFGNQTICIESLAA
ncbi:hypothetical protein UPYG_G00050440 [Umbra pygmaea]|uniref:Uncharacterized protein n=1 Tax=Umbra pygmaea TaxID=75934 RepID=A0ABD0XRU7_UMBPY